MADIFKPEEMLQLLKGKKILIIGDSSECLHAILLTDYQASYMYYLL